MVMDSTSETHLQLSAGRYESVADSFRLAAGSFGIEIPDTTYDHWKQTLSTIRRLDILLDEDDGRSFGERETEYLSSIDYLEGKTADFSSDNEDLDTSVQALRDSSENLDDDQRALFGTTARGILRVTKRIKTAESAAELGQLTRLEGQLTARLFSGVLPRDIPLKANRDFNHWLSRVGRFANVYDTAIDLRKDYDANEVRVTPSIANRVTVAWQARGDLAEIRTGLNWPLLKSLGHRAIETFKGRAYTYRHYGSAATSETTEAQKPLQDVSA